MAGLLCGHWARCTAGCAGAEMPLILTAVDVAAVASTVRRPTRLTWLRSLQHTIYVKLKIQGYLY